MKQVLRSEFTFFDDTYAERDGYPYSVMDENTGRVYGITEAGDVQYLSTQEYKSGMRGICGEHVLACIIDYDPVTGTGIWDY